jgi:inositol polyphosphate 5-phosphatase INPP5B/F
VLETAMKELDRLENDARPDVELSTQLVEFEPVEFLRPQTVHFTVENKKHVPCRFKFTPKPGSETLCKPYFWMGPTSGIVFPGRRETISVMVNVDSQTAPKLNSGEDKLDDVVILSLVNGRDCFISICAKEYLPTCFANDVQYLIDLPGPIRGETRPQGDTTASEKPKVPAELTRMLEYLEECGGMDCVGPFSGIGK